MTKTANCELTEVNEADFPSAANLNSTIHRLDALTQLVVATRTNTAPPAGSVQGDMHIVAAVATGAWANQERRIAYLGPNGWIFITPRPYWRAFVAANNAFFKYSGTSWDADTAGSGTVTQVGLEETSARPLYSVAGSPVNSLGTIFLELNEQEPNTVFAGPAEAVGSPGALAEPMFRPLVPADIPYRLRSLTSFYAAADATVVLEETGEGTDEKLSFLRATGGDIEIGTMTDALAISTSGMRLMRDTGAATIKRLEILRDETRISVHGVVGQQARAFVENSTVLLPGFTGSLGLNTVRYGFNPASICVRIQGTTASPAVVGTGITVGQFLAAGCSVVSGTSVTANVTGGMRVVSQEAYSATARGTRTELLHVKTGTTAPLIVGFKSLEGVNGMPVNTVATLPAAATVGDGCISFVSDALAPAFGAAVVGGGAVTVPVHTGGGVWNVG